jgi:uncharacterized protein (TIGR00297 family)
MKSGLEWQSRAVLLLVLPYVGLNLALQTRWWWIQAAPVAIWTLALGLLLGAVTLKLRAATVGASIAGFAITASLMFSTGTFPHLPWRTALTPVLAVALLTHLATQLGRAHKEELGLAEPKRGRDAAQIAANLGAAALASSELAQAGLLSLCPLARGAQHPGLVYAVGLAALAEAAADTVSSEIGQVLGGTPRMITTLHVAEPGTDGAISLLGSLAGTAAALLVAGLGTWALRGDLMLFAAACGGGVFGLFFDSLLGATVERRGWLNNDAVNFLSTGAAATFTAGLLLM